MQIPYQQLSHEALEALLDDVVTRNGTDYGEVEVSSEQRKHQLRAALESKQACIVFDPETETINVVSRQQMNDWLEPKEGVDEY